MARAVAGRKLPSLPPETYVTQGLGEHKVRPLYVVGAGHDPADRSPLEPQSSPRSRIVGSQHLEISSNSCQNRVRLEFACKDEPRSRPISNHWRSRMFVGIDISKAKLDIAILPSGELFEVKNTPSGIADLITRFDLERPEVIVLEPSGGPAARVKRCPAARGAGSCDAHQRIHQRHGQACQDRCDEHRLVRSSHAP